MANGKFVAYYRVSTKRQGQSGLGLDAQKDAVRDYLNNRRASLIAEVTEIETGTSKRRRPALDEALSLCRIHNATLVIAKLDRLSRNVAFISNLMESRIEFVACDFPEVNRLTIHVLAAVAEHEASAISARTKAALAATKARGVRLGGNRGNLDSEIAMKGNAASAAVRRGKAKKHAADLLPVIAAIKAEGMTTLRQIAAVLNERQIPAAGGGMWTATQVRRVVIAG